MPEQKEENLSQVSTGATWYKHAYIEGGKFYENTGEQRVIGWIYYPFKIVFYTLLIIFIDMFVGVIFMPALIVLGVIEVILVLAWICGIFNKKKGIYKGACPHCNRVFYTQKVVALNCIYCTHRIVIEGNKFVAVH